MATLVVEVTRDDIMLGIPGDAEDCAAVCVLRRMTAWMYPQLRWAVESKKLTAVFETEWGAGIVREIATPKKLAMFIARFDKLEGKAPMEVMAAKARLRPFKFVLEADWLKPMPERSSRKKALAAA